MTAMIYEDERLKNRPHVFKNRYDAGLTLAEMLRPNYAGNKKAIVLAVPSGGVPVGAQIARSLALPMDLLLVKKLQIPANPEAGFGAVTLEGKTFMNEILLPQLPISDADIESQKNKAMGELEVRNSIFRKNRPFPDLKDKTAIIADDGLASGYTMMASIFKVKEHGARKVTVAVPTASDSVLSRLEHSVDEIYCPNIRKGGRFAVAEAYTEWHVIDDAEALDIFNKAAE